MEVADHALPAAVAAELDGGDAFGQWHAVLSWRMEHRGWRPIRLAPDCPVSPDPERRAPAGPQQVQVHEGVAVGAGQGCLLSQSAPFLSRKLDPRSTCGGGSRGGRPAEARLRDRTTPHRPASVLRVRDDLRVVQRIPVPAPERAGEGLQHLEAGLSS
jgi:hypothetical protein